MIKATQRNSTKVLGKMANSMGLEETYGLLVPDTKVNLKIVSGTEWAYFIIPMGPYIMKAG